MVEELKQDNVKLKEDLNELKQYNLKLTENLKEEFKQDIIDSTTPVSYTHLDVYKRQTWHKF